MINSANNNVLIIRSMPYDFNPESYNVQEIGIGKALCNFGYNCDYITFKKKDQKEWVFYEENGCKARWIEKPRIRFLRMGFNSEICDKRFLAKYDIIICREYYQYMTYKVSQNHKNVAIYNGPYWNMFMIPPFSILYDFLFTKKINEAVKCIFTKSELSSNFLRKKGYTKLKSIGVALDTSRFDDVEIEKQTEEVVKFMNNNKCILYVGSIDKNKNYKFLLSVYERLLKTYPDLKFVVIGKSKQLGIRKLFSKNDESYEKACYKSMPENVKKGILRIQNIDNSQLKYIYPHALAFLLPSKREIFGMVLLEAMYLGAPVVTSKNGGSVTLIKNKQTGKMINNFNVDEWAYEVSEYLDNAEIRKMTVKRAKKLIIEQYNWNVLVKEMLKPMI